MNRDMKCAQFFNRRLLRKVIKFQNLFDLTLSTPLFDLESDFESHDPFLTNIVATLRSFDKPCELNIEHTLHKIFQQIYIRVCFIFPAVKY